MARKKTLLAGEEPTGEENNTGAEVVEPAAGEEQTVPGEGGDQPTEPVEPTGEEPTGEEPSKPAEPPAEEPTAPDAPAEEPTEENKRFFETYASSKSLYPVNVMRRRRR